jgi:membrane protease YdiL (CAAX protease family)
MPAGETRVHPSAFFALTFALSWLIWIPLALSHFGIGPLHIPEETSTVVRLLGVLMPATAALLLSVRTGGRPAVRQLLSRLTIWRVGWRWWAAAVLVQPLLLFLAAWIYRGFGGNSRIAPEQPVAGAALVVNGLFLLIATLGEEIGWRGVALPALQQRCSPLVASGILGVLWASWHIPFWLLMDTFDQFGVGYLALNFLLLPLAFYITWFYNHGRSSLLLPVAFHLSFNLVNTIWLPVTTNISAFTILIAFEWVLAIIVCHDLEPDRRREKQFALD